MDHVNSILTFHRRKGCFLVFRVVIMGMIMVARVASSEDQMGVPESGLLCISDCATCPVICSPPPPAKEYSSPPPIHHSPPQSHYHSPPPPQSPSAAPPPATSWSYWGPPPPPFKYGNTPPSGQAPPMVGPHDYPYPYYYFYASKASSISCHYASMLVLMMFYCFVLFCF